MTSYCVYVMLQAAILAHLHIRVTNGLVCYCDICVNQGYKCTTDGYCFASTSIDKNGLTKYQYRCLNKTNFFPPEYPVHCTRKHTSTWALTCCNSSDMCNKDVIPTLAPPTSPLPADGTEGT